MATLPGSSEPDDHHGDRNFSDGEEAVMMEPAEIDVIKSFLSPKTIMFEFGSGGSTPYWSKRVQRLYSAEHSPAWASVVKQQCESLTNVTLLTAEPNRDAWERLGMTGIGIFDPQIQLGDNMRITFGPNMDDRWRLGSTEERLSVFCAYTELVGSTPEPRFDVVLIDGRARGEVARRPTPIETHDLLIASVALDPNPNPPILHLSAPWPLCHTSTTLLSLSSTTGT